MGQERLAMEHKRLPYMYIYIYIYIYIINKQNNLGHFTFPGSTNKQATKAVCTVTSICCSATGGLEVGVVGLFGGNMINKNKTKTGSGTDQSGQVTPELAD